MRSPIALLLVATALVAAGCSTYANTASQLRERVDSGDLPGALELLEKRGGDDPDVLNLLERGLLLFYEGRFQESNTALQRAEDKIDELYSKNVGKEALAFLTNDGTLPYSGYPHEQVMLHIYGALNYMALGETEDALVEVRRVSNRLAVMEDLRKDKQGYSTDGFAEWLSGILYADDGDANGALVSARRAMGAYDEANTMLQQPLPEALIADRIGWARRFGSSAEAQSLAETYPEIAARVKPLPPNEGELILVYESGYVSRLVEQKLSFPIFKHDDNPDPEAVYRRGHRGVYRDTGKVELAYWLEVATPVMQPTHPQLRSARMTVGGQSTNSFLAQDVSAIAKLTFDEGSASRTLRTIGRAIAKAVVTEKIKKKDSVLGFLANVTGALTERADTRSWSTLPDRIHMARIRLPEGVHAVEVEILDAQGRVGQTATFEQVEIVPGEITLLHHRSYR